MNAQDTSRIATNSSGVRCCNPIFPVMKEELQSMTNKNGASLTNITIPVSGESFLPSVHDRVENAASMALRVLMVSLLASTSTSLQRTTAPCAMLFFNLTRWASPIGSAPAARLT